MNNTREHIIETAFLLFLKKGFKPVRLSDVEKAAGISRGTFYYHFTNKEEVLKEGVMAYYKLINSRREKEFGEITTLKEFVDLTIRKLQGIDNYTARSFDSDIPEILCLSLVAQSIAIFPELEKEVITAKMSRLSKLEQLIHNAQSEGELKADLDTSVLAKNFLNIGAGVLNYLIMHQDVGSALSSIRSQYAQLYAMVKTG